MIPDEAVDNIRMTITEFLEARIAENEQLARDAIADDMGQDGGFEDAFDYLTKGELLLPSFGEAAARMIVWNTPRRVLAECAAKRAIITQWDDVTLEDGVRNERDNIDEIHSGLIMALRDVLKVLAAVYADHPDYQQEWAL